MIDVASSELIFGCWLKSVVDIEEKTCAPGPYKIDYVLELELMR